VDKYAYSARVARELLALEQAPALDELEHRALEKHRAMGLSPLEAAAQLMKLRDAVAGEARFTNTAEAYNEKNR
jgi:hypothetical protein